MVVVKESWENEEDVADSWDAEEDEPVVTKAPVKAAPAPAKPPAKAKAQPEAPAAGNETPEQQKQRLNRLIQESDLENAMALFGISKDQVNVDEVLGVEKKPSSKSSSSLAASSAAASSASASPFDAANPQSWSEFEAFSALISARLTAFEGSKHFPNFLEHLIRSLLVDREVPEIRKVANMASELAASKQRDKLAAVNKKKAPPSLAGVSKKRTDLMDFGDDDGEFDDY